MDYDANLVKLQKALCSFSSSNSGNNEQKKERIEIFGPIFQRANKTEKSKMVFFLLLNTRLKVTEVLKDDINVGLFTDICPNLEVPDLVDIIVDLELYSSFSDIIRNCPGVLSLELLRHFHLKLPCTQLNMEGVQEILVATYEKIEKIQTGFHNEYSLKEFLDVFENLLQYLGQNIQMLGKSEDCSLLALNCLLETYLFCTMIYKDNTKILCDNPIFALDFSLLTSFSDCYKDELNKVENFDEDLHLRLHMTQMLELISPILGNVENLDFSSQIMRRVSENAYLLCEEVKGTPVEPKNVHYLQLISRKPVTESDEIAKSDMDTIISRINKKPAKNWFSALVHYPKAFETEEACLCIMNHLELASSTELKSIIDAVRSESEKLNVVPTHLQNLYLNSLRKMALDDQLFCLDKYFERRVNFFWEESLLDEELTEKFNKISESDRYDPTTKTLLIEFCIRSPLKTIAKICQQALASATQLNFCVEHLKMLKSACLSKSFAPQEENPNLNIINSVLHGLIVNEDVTAKEKEHLTNLISRLLKERLLDDEFVEFCVVEAIQKELMAGGIQNVNFLLDVLKLFVKSKTLHSNHAVLMAFMVQVLTHASWDCSTFSLQLVNIREAVISITVMLMRGTKITDDLELAWLRQQVLKSPVINQLYFCDLWFSYDCEFVASNELYIQLFMLLHTKSRVHFIIDFVINQFQFKKLLDLRTCFSVALIKLCPVLTSKEWMSLFTHIKSIISSWSELQAAISDFNLNLEVLGIFTMSMYCLAQDMNRNRGMTSCFEFCLRNFGKVIQQNFLSSPNLKSETGLEVVKKLLFILIGIREFSSRKSSSMILSPIIFEIVNRTAVRGSSDAQPIGLEELEVWFQEDFI